MRSLFLSFTFTWLAGCAAPGGEGFPPPDGRGCDRVYYVTPEFNDGERAALDRAVARWNAIALERWCLTDKESSDHSEPHSIYKIPYRGAEWQKISDMFGGSDVYGVAWGDDRTGIVDSLSIELFEVVALHELGHLHGLDHISEPGIMFPHVGTAWDFTSGDLEECRRVGACAGGNGAVEIVTR